MALSISGIKLINILFIAAGIGICSLCFMQVTGSKQLRKEIRHYFQIFFALIFAYITTHLVRELMEGLPGSGVRTTLYIVTFLEILAAGLMAHMISMLVLSVTKRGESPKKNITALAILLALHTALLIADIFTDMIYYFDDANVYHRGAWYLLSNVSPLGMLIIDVVLLVRHGAKIDSRVRTAFWVYLIAPVAAIAIQSFSYGVQCIIFATVGAAVYMFSVIVHNQNESFTKQEIEKSRIETELSMASRIQADMLPSIYPAFPERKEFDIYATMDPAKEVAGDFYDFFLVDEDHLGIVMADVSGKGVPAALFMMASKIILANNAMLGKSPAQVLTDTNNAICSNNRADMFVTVWLGVLELSTGKLVAANAGHEYPVLQQANGKFELVKDRHGFVIGGMEGMKYTEYEIMMQPGSKLFLYTDGVPEANNAQQELFGSDRMLAALNADTAASPKGILEQVRCAVDEFSAETEQFDDLTMLCLEYRGGADTKQ